MKANQIKTKATERGNYKKRQRGRDRDKKSVKKQNTERERMTE